MFNILTQTRPIKSKLLRLYVYCEDTKYCERESTFLILVKCTLLLLFKHKLYLFLRKTHLIP